MELEGVMCISGSEWSRAEPWEQLINWCI